MIVNSIEHFYSTKPHWETIILLNISLKTTIMMVLSDGSTYQLLNDGFLICPTPGFVTKTSSWSQEKFRFKISSDVKSSHLRILYKRKEVTVS